MNSYGNARFNLDSHIFENALNHYKSPDMSLAEFIPLAWDILEPGNPLIRGWHIDYIAEHLELVYKGDLTRLLINILPRSAKSNIVTIIGPAWAWTKNPSLRFIFCSYSASLSTKHSVDRRRLIESQWYKQNWGGIVQITDDQNQKHEYENTARGHMIATSVGGTITGKGGDIIVEDDMMNPLEAESEAMRRHAISMHKHVLSNRLDNPKTGRKIIVEQRTHVNDISGIVLKEETGYTHIELPMMFEDKKTFTFPISKKEITMMPGDFLNPERQGIKEFEETKRTMGTRAFNSQYQQKPVMEQGNILQRKWWQYWSGDYKSLLIEFYCQCWDMTFVKSEKGSYVVGQVWGKRGNRFFLLDQIRQRMDFTETLAAMVNLSARWPQATLKMIEDKANGPAVMAVLKEKLTGIVPVTPLSSKLARAQAIAPMIEAGNVYIPDPIQYPWASDFIEECAAFTGGDGEANDQVDAMSHALNRMRDLNTTYQPQHVEESFIEEDLYNMESAGGFR